MFDDGHSASSARHTHEQHLLLNASSDDVKQSSLADRAINPSVQDVCRLFQHWREKCYGKEDGLPLFQRLQLEVDTYNAKNSEQGGKAILQWYEKHSDMSDVEEEPKKKRRKRDHSDKPLIIAICTPLMSRAHKNICQAGELVFLDSSSSMDRFNTSIFIMSTHSSSSGIPLGVILTSDEREETIYNGLELLKSVMPENAFFGRSSRAGPQVFMTDDSIAERAALHKCWPHAVIFLCTFHFLQRLWTWLLDGKNKIDKEDRVLIINEVKTLVYERNETNITKLYDNLVTNTNIIKYPSFVKHFKILWDKRSAWAHCFRKNVLIRGNNTNNYAEAGIKILKEFVFSRVKAFNLVQMFTFIYDVMDLYYQKKLIAISNHRFDTYIALRFQGLISNKVLKENIARFK